MTTTVIPTFATLREPTTVGRRRLVHVSVAAAVWGFGYAAYRGYYAAGGTFGIPGVPASESGWRLTNLAGAAIIAAGAALTLAVLPLWTRRRTRSLLLAAFWLVAVFCVTHALVMMTERVMSLTGHLQVDYPDAMWISVDRRAADLQDLFFNEPWFLVEGLAYATIAWVGSNPGRPRRRWTIIGVAAVAVGTTIGLLSAAGVIGKVIVG